MELISQHAKKIMEGCKERARSAGLTFQEESLEYIVTNRDFTQLSPKNMIPTLYDYWVQDVEVLKEQGQYELYPSNPYETVINTRPPISYYNDNNPDWLNVMIFYHVLGHIDFFNNNLFFRHTWDYDFAGKALSDKRLIAKLRSEKGRWVDYIIEFSKGIDNLVGYYDLLSSLATERKKLSKLDYYFDIFLQQAKDHTIAGYVAEIERYNAFMRDNPDDGESRFLDSIKSKYAEFESLYAKAVKDQAKEARYDLLQFLMDNSEFLGREENRWMKTVIEVIRTTSLYFQPQIRTKILNEGWASYWHETLFLMDDRIDGHEVDYAVVNAKVTSMPRVGLNPYALGMRLFYFLESEAESGKISYDYQRIANSHRRNKYHAGTGQGKAFIFDVRENFCDSMFVNNFINQDFVDKYRLFVVDKWLDKKRMVWKYYIKSKKAEDYKKMVLDSLYHPPAITINVDDDNTLTLNHVFEGKPLYREYISATLMGVEYLWGRKVCLYTYEPELVKKEAGKKQAKPADGADDKIRWRRYKYTMKDRKMKRVLID
ncbi:MAG: SpoVR family protein [Desulforhopalus sp.]